MDKRLLDILCCPVSKRPLRLASASELAALKQAPGPLLTVAGQTVEALPSAALITTDGQLLYPIEEGIPVLLPEAGIGTQQLAGNSAAIP